MPHLGCKVLTEILAIGKMQIAFSQLTEVARSLQIQVDRDFGPA